MRNHSPDLARAATIADVARVADVSVRTVSRVLNKSPKVGETTRATIERAIADLGFRPSMRARGLAARRSFLLGVVQGDQNDHVIGRLQHGIVEICSEAGYELLVHPVSVADPRLSDNLEDFVRRTHVDGLVLLSPVSELPEVPHLLGRLGVPAVGLASVRIPGYPAMLVGGERIAATTVADHLIALGHRRIAMITGPLRFHSATEREQGFRTALDRAGIALPRGYVVEGDYGFDSGLVAAEHLLALPNRPTAIFASNDIMAAAVLKVARERGIDVPGALSVTGFDDVDLASMLSPSLTTIRRPLRDIAREAARRVIALAEGEASRLPDLDVPLALVERQSTAPPPA
ncbi:LacI family DNA-binding transcriptional regulator [Sphingomonas nostoxanthinifaciens]|uniref:LacI family DNA-binding transcriptional regulator n=1 Tax=Sphingomonas nostoxanthinifaciens TaxID=2872652 RepID=UPI001CC2035C|nr:LacI family DNA-binding transcriptional regulator [Sphingomonas nostoxanthinifaciens]